MKLALIFPGQGSQHIGMGRGLYDEFPVARRTFAEADEALGYGLTRICFEGRLRELNRPENMLPAILTVSVAAFRVFMEEISQEPAFLAGHSLGEYSALTCSGALPFADAVRLVHRRSLLASQVKGGVMSVVTGVSQGQVDEACRMHTTPAEPVALACCNGPDQFVISGHQAAVMRAEDHLIALNGQVTPLLTTPPFHSPLLAPVAPALEAELNRHAFGPFRWPVIANVTARPYGAPEQAASLLTRQLTDTVRWTESLAYLQAQGVELVVELGPQSVLASLVAASTSLEALSFGQKEDRQKLWDRLAVKYDPHAPTVVTRCLAVAVSTRNRNQDPDEYQAGVVEPYERIEQLQEELEANRKSPTAEQMRLALGWLRTILTTKQVPHAEQERRIRQILTETGTAELLADLLV